MPVLPVRPETNGGGGPACPGLCSTRCSILPYACLAAGCSAPCRHALSSLHLQDGSRQEQKCLCCTFSLQSHPSCPRLRIHDPASPGKTHPEGPIGEPAPLGGGTGPRAVPTQGCLLPSLLQPAPPPQGSMHGSRAVPSPVPSPRAGCCPVGPARWVTLRCCGPKGWRSLALRLSGFGGSKEGDRGIASIAGCRVDAPGEQGRGWVGLGGGRKASRGHSARGRAACFALRPRGVVILN